MIFALVGNQNCGKTTLFNQLTGANQHVGNFPGVTVDSKSGSVRGQKDCEVVDLPGIYSLRPFSTEEIVTRDFLIKNRPNGIINIVDATNIERNLYLTLQLIEMRIPMVIALNMMDEVRGNGGSVDTEKLSESLGVKVIPISAAKNEGVDDLISAAVSVAASKTLPSVHDFCLSGPVHRCIHAVSHLVEDHADAKGMSPRFAATKLVEGDSEITKSLALNQNELELLEHSIIEMENSCGLDRNAALADMRYSFIEKACGASVVHMKESREHIRSVRIDRLLTNRFLAIPVFIGILLLIFWLSFSVIGSYLSGLLSTGIDSVTAAADAALTSYGINPVVHSLIIDGVFAGVGNVLIFLPIIVVLFFFLSILEDTGYMARIAFVTDKLLRKIDLSGRSVVPMLIGFGCSVPAIMATRTLSSDRDRKMTIMLIPFMSCSAKIPIYAVFAAAFFKGYEPLVMICLYLLGIITGVIVMLVFKKTLFRGSSMPFVMELPNYRFPSLKSVLLLMKEKAVDFLQRAFTVIFFGAIIIWFLQTFDAKLFIASNPENSLLALFGKLLVPVFRPLGFSDWRISTSLISGLAAKEAVVSTMGVLTGSDAQCLSATLRSLFPDAVSAISFLVFTLLYTPCIAAIAAIRRELNSSVKTLGVILYQCTVAWLAAFIIYNILSFLI